MPAAWPESILATEAYPGSWIRLHDFTYTKNFGGPLPLSVGVRMIQLPRLALAIPPLAPEPTAASLAILAGLARRRWRVQHFRSRACPFGTEAVGQISGLPGRHLDAWLMPAEVCQTVFVRGAVGADLALVEGTLSVAGDTGAAPPYDLAGNLRPLIRALDLPTVALVACPRLGGLHVPRLPDSIDAILLDGLEEGEDYEATRRVVSLILEKPVIGAVGALPEVREALDQAPRDRPIADDLFDRLGESFLRHADLAAIRALAESRPLDAPPGEPCRPPRRRFRVAYAQDEAFGAYFPDTLETLEGLGAELIEFSPIRDEALPDAIDLVMIGCGKPDYHLDALTANLSLIHALRDHVCQGRRIYSEGGGTAYLGRQMSLGDRIIPGAGILPIHAELLADPTPPMPVSRVLTRDGWLGPRGTTVRGYRSGRWRLQSAPERVDCPGRSGPLTAQNDVFFRHHAVGSLIHLHLGALPEVVAAFACPHQPSLSLP